MARRSGTRRVATYLLAGTAMASALGNPAWAEFPGEVWSVSFVRVNGAAAPETASGLTLGLTNASDVYFYGDAATRIDAEVTSSNAMDLRMVDLATGKVVAERRGLPFDGAGDVAETVSTSALAWMESLNCAEGCTVAVSGPAPQPVQVAVAPVKAEPVEEQPEVKEPPQPEPVVVEETAQPEAVEVEQEAREAQPAPVMVVTPPKAEPVQTEVQPEPVIALSQPEVTPPKKSAPVTQAELANPSAEALVQGLDADQVLAAIEAPAMQKPQVNVAEAPRADTSSAQLTTSVALPRPETAEPTVNALAKPENAAIIPAAVVTAEQAPDVALIAPAAEVAQPQLSEASTVTAQPEVVAAVSTEEVKLPASPQVAVPKPAVRAPSAIEVPAITEVQAPQTVEEPIVVDATAPQTTGTEDTSTSEVETTATAGSGTQIEEQLDTQVTEAPAEETSTAQNVTEQTTTPETTPPAVLINPAPAGGADDRLARANPVIPQLPTLPSGGDTQKTTPPPATDGGPPADEEGDTVETQLAAVDPQQDGPTLANARWIGFTPAVFTGADTRPGAWIAGPFDRKQRTGWITDTATGATTRVTFYWREASSGGRTATLSREAAQALGIGQGDVANIAVYLPR